MLSLIELQNKKVEAKRKKYEKEEMDEYLALVFDNYKQLLEENKKLESEKVELNKKIKTLSDGVQYYRSIETTLQKALILAEKTSKETKDAAILKAESIERDAQKRAETIIQRAEGEYNQIREKSARLVQQFNQYKLQLREAANAQLQLVDGNEFDITEPVAENVTTTAPVSTIDDVVVEDIVPDTKPTNDVTETLTQSTTSASETSVAEEPIVEAVSENVLQQAEALTTEPEETPMLDTSKEELLNADTIDLSNTLEVVQTETDTDSKTEPEKNTISSPTIAEVKEAVVVKPVVAKTIDATPVSIADTKKEVVVDNVSSDSTLQVAAESNAQKEEPTLEEVLTQKKETSSAATGGGIPTLDSLLQDLNMNNKGNQNSDDPFEFLGSIDDDF